MKNLSPPLWTPDELRAEAEALRQRAQRISDGAWCQHYAATDGEGNMAGPERDPSAKCFCAGTHIDYFTPHPRLGTMLVNQALRTEITNPTVAVVAWNDAKRRKAYQVARAFRAAAARGERYARILDSEVPA